MGFGVPAAIGAKVGRPERTVWCIDGDGCFQMTAQELVTARSERHPDQGGDPQQRLPRHGAPVARDVLRGALLRGLPQRRPTRLREVGRGHGLRGPARAQRSRRCTRSSHGPTRSTTCPVVIDFRTDATEKVFPMVASGASNDDIIVHPLLRGRTSELPNPSSARSSARAGAPPHPVGAGGEQGGCARAYRRTLCPSRIQHLLARRRARSEGNARFSRVTIVVDAESAPLEQIVGQLDKLINVVAIKDLAPRDAARARAACSRRSTWTSPTGARSSTWRPTPARRSST